MTTWGETARERYERLRAGMLANATIEAIPSLGRQLEELVEAHSAMMVEEGDRIALALEHNKPAPWWCGCGHFIDEHETGGIAHRCIYRENCGCQAFHARVEAPVRGTPYSEYGKLAAGIRAAFEENEREAAAKQAGGPEPDYGGDIVTLYREPDGLNMSDVKGREPGCADCTHGRRWHEPPLRSEAWRGCGAMKDVEGEAQTCKCEAYRYPTVADTERMKRGTPCACTHYADEHADGARACSLCDCVFVRIPIGAGRYYMPWPNEDETGRIPAEQAAASLADIPLVGPFPTMHDPATCIECAHALRPPWWRRLLGRW